MSLGSLLSIARSALLTQQKAIDVTGHNVANAGTEGYTRQRLSLSANTPLQTTIGQLGRGVQAVGIERLRDQFLEGTFRRENGDLGKFTTLQDLLGQVEGVFGEPSDTGISSGLDQLFSAFSDLANDPSGTTPRELARQAATNLTQQFNEADRRLNEIGNTVHAKIDGAVTDINEIARQIAVLNTQVRGGAAGLREAPDIKDQRDKLVDQLSSIVGVRVLQHDDGSIGVLAGDVLLVDAGQSLQLETRDLGQGKFGVGVVGSSGRLAAQSGNLSGLLELSSTTIPAVRAQLDTLVKGIVTEVNTLHRGGRTLSGGTNVDFFNPTGLTAASMAVSQAVQNSTDNIAAGTLGTPGDNSIALAISGLRTTGVASFGGETLSRAYQRVISGLGVQVRDAGQKQTAQEVVVSQADGMRKSVSGVSIDEELTTLISQQNAYAAAARLVNVADEMMQDVLAMVR